MRVAIIGCGVAKLTYRAPARDLYTGPLFRDALQHAQAQGFDRIFVLSAKHGVVELDQEIDPYDLRLDDLNAMGQEALGAFARARLRRLCGGPADLTIFAGHPYALLLAPLAEEGWTLNEPLAGLNQGARRRWFAERRVRPAAASVEIVIGSSLDEARRVVTLATYEACRSNVTVTARVLGVSRRSLQTWLSAWGVRPKEETHAA